MDESWCGSGAPHGASGYHRYGLGGTDGTAADALLDDHGNAELVITGRNPWPYLVEKADYITEMRPIRHPYEKGVPARKGIEF